MSPLAFKQEVLCQPRGTSKTSERPSFHKEAIESKFADIRNFRITDFYCFLKELQTRLFPSTPKEGL